ncbi:MAG: hypothetical protein SGJ21_01435 [Alphaproteobacteria bacterium]|nr:hypothetical protein [Alphaproteobacteria bacterium]
MRVLLLGAIALAGAPAFAQSAQNASKASGQTSLAVGAIGESGLRATSGVVAIPLGVTAVASGAVGVGASASGQTGLAGGFSGAAVDASRGAKALVDFSNAPLSITDDIVMTKPQPAPNVPYTPVAAQ